MDEQDEQNSAGHFLRGALWVLQAIAATALLALAGVYSGLNLAPPRGMLETVPVGYDSLQQGPGSNWWPYLAILAAAIASTVLVAYRGPFRGIGQVAGALWLLFNLHIWSSINVEGIGSSIDICGGDGCHEEVVEQVMLVLPVLAGALAMIVSGIFARWMHWGVRMAFPVAVFLGATVLQIATWDSVIVPFLGMALG
ncbi:hypothetical protein GCM10022377_22660 [Zhihengliuella alba]|uniref:Tryptophan-rich sensory protein n=1 Tax=Zhihengliuella alba TaxID=547018 RepID=A0ABP7DQY2_9MICC